MYRANNRSRIVLLAVTVASTITVAGCGHYPVEKTGGTLPGHCLCMDMQVADDAVTGARAAGKAQKCPAEFKSAEDAKDNAYQVYWAGNSDEGIALAKKAAAQANALCPTQVVEEAPAPAVPAPVPPPAAPSDDLAVAPASISKGQSATLTWSSQNAKACDIEPGIGPVQPQGSMIITPADNTAYTLNCSGAGGSASSTTSIMVMAPAPVVAAVKPVVLPHELCTPAVLDIHFDTNKSDIKPQYDEKLKKLADLLKEFPGATGTVEGYTDNVGNRAANMKLSQRRADSVRTYLIGRFGIDPERIKAVGYGPTRPKADNGTKAGREQNRRIESNFNCNDKS